MAARADSRPPMPRRSFGRRRGEQGGLAPLPGMALYHWTGVEEAPAFLVLAVVLASVLVIVRMRETAGFHSRIWAD